MASPSGTPGGSVVGGGGISPAESSGGLSPLVISGSGSENKSISYQEIEPDNDSGCAKNSMKPTNIRNSTKHKNTPHSMFIYFTKLENFVFALKYF